jgi:hypothetical protein
VIAVVSAIPSFKGALKMKGIALTVIALGLSKSLAINAVN